MCPAAACITKKHGRLDAFICLALMSASEAGDEGSRTRGAALREGVGGGGWGGMFSTHSREKNGTMSACYEGDKRGNGWRKRQTGAAASLNIYLCLCTLWRGAAARFHYTSITAVVNGRVTGY